MGGQNLSKHWNRCLKMTGAEEWVWLFSDDDMMSPDCVATFYEYVDHPDVRDVLRFPLNGTDESGEFIPFRNPSTQMLTCEEFFCQIYLGKIDARMPEFVMRRSKLQEIGGFVPYDLAWRSDNATMMLMAYPHYIYNLPKGEVRWRSSTENVSGLDMLNKRKNAVTVQFFNWVDSFFAAHGLKYSMTEEELLKVYAYSLLPEQDVCPYDLLRDLAAKLHVVTTEEQRNIFMSAGDKSLVMHIGNNLHRQWQWQLDDVRRRQQLDRRRYLVSLVVAIVELIAIVLLVFLILR